MERHLNLIKTDHKEIEKRVFPRFPFSYLVFRGKDKDQSFQVKDISFSGMNLCLKDGECSQKVGEKLEGEIHWHGTRVSIGMTIKRVSQQTIGVEFNSGKQTQESIKQLLSVSNIAKSFKPIHSFGGQMELPKGLAYWLRCDGPFELFVWEHGDHEISKFQVILMSNFIEWNDGKGLSSGKVLSVKNNDTPLTSEEEFEFQFDNALDEEKLSFAKELVCEISKTLLPEEVLEFITRKVGI